MLYSKIAIEDVNKEEDGVQAATVVLGDPQPANVFQEQGDDEQANNTMQSVEGEEGEAILVLPNTVKKASLEILDKVAAELSEDQQDSSLRLAMELDELAEVIQKNAFVISEEKKSENGVMDSFDKGNRVIDGEVGTPDKGAFEKDISYEVQKNLQSKKASPYLKL